MKAVRNGGLVGIVSATATLVAISLISSGLYTSETGLMIVAVAAFIVGTGAAQAVDPRVGRNAGIVAIYIVFVMAVYLVGARIGPESFPGARGGPGVPVP